MKLKQKEPVRLRAKELKDGNKSLYLDCYFLGRRSYEFLKLYLIPEISALDKERNRVTMIQAESMKARRIIEYQQGIYGAVHGSFVSRVNLSEYILKICEKKNNESEKSCRDGYMQVARLVKEYGDIALQKAGKRYFEGFITFLNSVETHGKKLGESTKSLRFDYMNSVMNKAVRDRLIQSNPISLIDTKDRPKRNSREVEYLTLEEVRRMGDSACRLEKVKRAFMFACFCGLRLSDIRALCWQDIKKTKDGWQVELRQQKTKNFIYVPLSDNAVQWLPEKASYEEKIFGPLPDITTIGKVLRKWAAAAGVSKHVTFHVSRHTCATLLLTYGADLYTVSKILGHTNIATTQIYAKVVDKKRVEAVSLIPKL